MNEITTAHAPSALELTQTHDLAAFFAKPDALDDVLARIESEVRSYAPDTSTAKGRKEIASLAAKVAKSKTALDNAGKALNEDHRKAINAVDAERRKVRDRLDALKTEARAPLTEWEEAEEQRVEALKARIERLRTAHERAHDASAEEIRALLTKVEAVEIDESWQEFATEADLFKSQAVTTIRHMLDAAEKREADAAELERLRRESAEREEADRKRREAEETEQLRLAAEKAEKERQERIDREKAEAAARAAREAQERAAREAKEAEQRHARELAEAKAREEAAAQRERDRIEAERRAEEEARAKREADKKHRAKIKADIVAALSAMSGKATPDAIADALMAGEIPHTEVRI